MNWKTLIALLTLAVPTMGQFPAEQVWRVGLETTATCLGTTWVENDKLFAVIGTTSGVEIISSDSVVWRSPEIGFVTAVARIDFGDGNAPEIIATVRNDYRAYVHLFNGENLSRHETGDIPGFYTSGRPWIGLNPSFQPGGTRLVNLWLPAWEYDEGAHIHYTLGHLIPFYLDSMAWGDVYRVNYPASVLKNDLNNDGHEDFIFCGNHWEEEHSEIEFEHYFADLYIMDGEDDSLSHYVLARQSYDGTWQGHALPLDLYSAALNQNNDSTSIIVSMLDGEQLGLWMFTAPDFHLASWRSTEAPFAFIGTVSNPDNGQFLIGLTAQCEVKVYHLPEFQEVLADSFLQATFVGAELTDFNGDGNKELLVLTPNDLRLFHLGPLSVPGSGFSPQPSSFILLPPYPNPFNSTTLLSFDLPRPGMTSVEVFDGAGRLAATPFKGFLSFGRQRIVWNAAGMATGEYIIRLNSAGRSEAARVQLLR